MKNLPIMVGVIVLLILAVGGYMYMQRKPASESANTQTTSENESQPASGMMSLKDLMNLGSSQKCTFSSSGDYGTTNGTTYVSGKNVRTDYSGADSQSKEFGGHSIMDGSYIYTWTDDGQPGFKMAITEDLEQAAEEMKEDFKAESSEQSRFDPNEKMDYKCSPWLVDSALFTPPPTVQFTDFSEQLEMMKKQVNPAEASTESSEPEGSADQCAVCDNVSGEAATACKQGLGCN